MDKVLSRISTAAGALTIGAFTVNSCIYNVDGGERAVMFDTLRGGILPDVRNEGTHFMIPVVQKPIIIDVRTKPREIPSVTGTKDLQMVNIKLRVLWRPVIEKLPQLYRELGTDFDERVLPSIGNEVLKSVVAQYNAEELLSKRAEVSNRIKTELIKRGAHFHLTLDDVAITHLTFGREFMRAIESKQVAFQEAERQQYVVQRAEQERIASVTRAEGEAEAATIITKAMERQVMPLSRSEELTQQRKLLRSWPREEISPICRVARPEPTEAMDHLQDFFSVLTNKAYRRVMCFRL
ncbi:prohibitin family protein [Skeletonema marinoi]|uniref:Prohibitin n=1 Tax=Skeletonema marinoi TaxID=267567 RepID=A0AAD8YM83_9STRA|nr:prohibitin family protein [Skeletonema marinoi]